MHAACHLWAGKNTSGERSWTVGRYSSPAPDVRAPPKYIPIKIFMLYLAIIFASFGINYFEIFCGCRPSEGSNPEDWNSQTEMDEYLKAEHTGRDDVGPCTEAYPDCSYSLLSAFTKIMFTWPHTSIKCANSQGKHYACFLSSPKHVSLNNAVDPPSASDAAGRRFAGGRQLPTPQVPCLPS